MLIKGCRRNRVIIFLMGRVLRLVQRCMLEKEAMIKMLSRLICRGVIGSVLICIGGRVTVTIV
jgi:hypothetical protein